MAGKKYLNAKKLVDSKKIYAYADAVKLAKDIAFAKFDEAIEIAIKLNVDTTKVEQQLRGTLKLPHYFGKVSRILVIDDSITKEEAKKAGADFFGGDEKIAEVKEGWLDFDVMITTPKFMPKISRLGKILGPKGLMPNPKLGTVTTNVLNAIKEFKVGKANYRTDTYGNVHMVIGKKSAKIEDVVENIEAIINFISSKRPSTVKGEYIKSIYIASSMGPSIRIK